MLNHKITPLNKNKTMLIKLSMSGSYAAGGGINRAMLFNLTGGVTDSQADNRGYDLFTQNDDVMTFITTISVDVGGNAVTVGVTPTIQSLVRTFTTTRLLLVVEQ